MTIFDYGPYFRLKAGYAKIFILCCEQYPFFTSSVGHFLISDRSWSGFLFVVIGVLTGFFVFNTLQFRDALSVKLQARSFMDSYPGAHFVRLSERHYSAIVDVSRIAPSWIAPRWMTERVMRERLMVVDVDAETGVLPASPTAFVSPAALDFYLFVCGHHLEPKAKPSYFSYVHELSHALALSSTSSLRASIGFAPIVLALPWILANITWTWPLIGSVGGAALALSLFARYALGKLRSELRFHAEISADFLACRRISAELAAVLLENSYEIRDAGLSSQANARRNEILRRMLRACADGDEFDVPSEYMRFALLRPIDTLLIYHVLLFLLLYWGMNADVSWWFSTCFCVVAAMAYIATAFADAAVRIELSGRFETEEESP